MSLMLGVLITLLLTPAFARWMYYEFGTAEGTQIEHPVHLGEFNYVVTLPGDPGTKPPVVTTPTPDTDTSEPDTTTTTTTTTTDPGGSDTPDDLDGKNHYNMIVILTGKTFEEVMAEYPDMDEEELRGFYNAVNLNVSSSITVNEIFNRNNNPFHSEYSSTSGSNYEQILENFDAELLSFAIHAVDNQTLQIYSYNRQTQEGTVEVYRTTVNYNSTTSKWETDLFSVVVGTAQVIKEKGRYIIDIDSFQPT